VAGSVLDILVPALMKQKFNGLPTKILTSRSSLSLGASTGGFAFLYRVLFRHIDMALDWKSSSLSTADQLRLPMRTDSGVDLDLDGEQNAEEWDDIETRLGRRKWVPAMLAAMFASPAFVLVPQQSRRLTMALYFCTYAGEVVYSALEYRNLTERLPNWFGIWLLFPVSFSQTIHTLIHHGDCFPVSNRHTLPRKKGQENAEALRWILVHTALCCYLHQCFLTGPCLLYVVLTRMVVLIAAVLSVSWLSGKQLYLNATRT
jgi:hypothetical protein